MSDVEPEALADVAYGLFEHTLNKELRDSGACLFELVESNTDFFDTFNTIFSRFSEDYPSLPRRSSQNSAAPKSSTAILWTAKGSSGKDHQDVLDRAGRP